MEFPLSKTTATVIQFKGGAVGQTAVSYEAHWPKGGQPKDHFLVVASMGVVFGDQYKLDADGEWRALAVDKSEIAAGCTGSVKAFLHSVTHGKKPPVSARDAYATLAACIAADESAAEGMCRTPDSENFL